MLSVCWLGRQLLQRVAHSAKLDSPKGASIRCWARAQNASTATLLGACHGGTSLYHQRCWRRGHCGDASHAPLGRPSLLKQLQHWQRHTLHRPASVMRSAQARRAALRPAQAGPSRMRRRSGAVAQRRSRAAAQSRSGAAPAADGGRAARAGREAATHTVDLLQSILAMKCWPSGNRGDQVGRWGRGSHEHQGSISANQRTKDRNMRTSRAES
jgi:hypothetical protein